MFTTKILVGFFWKDVHVKTESERKSHLVGFLWIPLPIVLCRYETRFIYPMVVLIMIIYVSFLQSFLLVVKLPSNGVFFNTKEKIKGVVSAQSLGFR